MKARSIFGPPGTGKTRTLVELAQKHADRGHRVKYLSYTKAAAAEATSRLPANAATPSTIHSMAFNALDINRASVVDAAKIRKFSAETGFPFRGDDEGTDEPQEGDEYKNAMSFSKNAMIEPQAAYDILGRPGTLDRFLAFVKSYDEWKRTFGYIDFDDMLKQFAKIELNSVPKQVIMLDEAQDCSPLQWAAFNNIVSTNPDYVYVAGDDDQAIFEWNGADPHGMVNFSKQHSADVRILEQSHRLPAAVHALAISTIETVKDRVPKKFRHTTRPGRIEHWRDVEMVVDKLHDVAPIGALILVRDRFKLGEVKKTFNRDLIPYGVYGGSSPWTNRTARDIRSGKINKRDVPFAWHDFYAQADLSQPIKYHLSTIHGAKGREHHTVIVDLELPARVLSNLSNDRDPEVRTQYVGITRSSDSLILCGTNPIVQWGG